MSKATIRHANAVSLKMELLKEVSYWKQACGKQIKVIMGGLTGIREARITVKRQIHTARAQLEERIRELEVQAEKRLYDLVEAEEKMLQAFAGKLLERQNE